jgi:hypothetical protein
VLTFVISNRRFAKHGKPANWEGVFADLKGDWRGVARYGSEVGRMTRAVLDAVCEVSRVTVVGLKLGHMARAVLDAVCKVSGITVVFKPAEVGWAKNGGLGRY